MKRLLLLFVPLIFLPVLISSCGYGRTMVVVGNDPGPMVVYHYWYYPAWGVYYDYENRVYFYQEGPAWRRVVHLPPRYHGLGHYVVVESERGKPWARYEAHRVKYPPPGPMKKEIRIEDRDDRGPGHGKKKHHFLDDRP
ncbi:MAG TPA: hypothetical protein VHE12_08075 [bacterium]|nr:hypothetical protein [bacterium]